MVLAVLLLRAGGGVATVSGASGRCCRGLPDVGAVWAGNRGAASRRRGRVERGSAGQRWTGGNPQRATGTPTAEALTVSLRVGGRLAGCVQRAKGTRAL